MGRIKGVKMSKPNKPMSKQGRINIANGHKGLKHSKETKLKMGLSRKHEKRPVWKGDRAGYAAIHSWVRQWKGNPLNCENCGIEGKKEGRNWSIQYANIDHKYRRVLEDYIRLCRHCHREYDIANNGLILGRRKTKIIKES